MPPRSPVAGIFQGLSQGYAEQFRVGWGPRVLQLHAFLSTDPGSKLPGSCPQGREPGPKPAPEYLEAGATFGARRVAAVTESWPPQTTMAASRPSGAGRRRDSSRSKSGRYTLRQT